MEEKKTGRNTTQYIRSGNMGNTIENTQRTTKEEDALNPAYSNTQQGTEGQQNDRDNNGQEEERNA